MGRRTLKEYTDDDPLSILFLTMLGIGGLLVCQIINPQPIIYFMAAVGATAALFNTITIMKTIIHMEEKIEILEDEIESP